MTGGKCKEQSFWVSLAAAKACRKKQKDWNIAAAEDSLSVTGLCITKQQQLSKKAVVRKVNVNFTMNFIIMSTRL